MLSEKAGRELATMRAVLAMLQAAEQPVRSSGETAAAPWQLMSSETPSSNGSFHLYVVDGNLRKIVALWGKQDEKLANCAARNGEPSALPAEPFAHDEDIHHGPP